MSVIRVGLDKLRRDGVANTVAAGSHLARRIFQNREYFTNPSAKRNSRLPTRNDAQVCASLKTLGVTVIRCKIHREDFFRWFEAAKFPSYYVEACDRRNDIWPNLFADKAIEYYVSASLLGLNADDTLIDVGANISPWYEMAERLYGCDGYALDLGFSPGIDGKRIGADATNMPVPDGFATKVSLHSAYECFQGTSDIHFWREAGRIVQDGGKVIILPLQLENFFYVLVSPYYSDTKNIDYGGAELVWEDYGWPLLFERWYSPEAFSERIIQNCNGFAIRIYYVENAHTVFPDVEWPRYYTRFAALFEKLPNTGHF